MNHYYINNTYKINYEIKRFLPFLPFIHQEILQNTLLRALIPFKITRCTSTPLRFLEETTNKISPGDSALPQRGRGAKETDLSFSLSVDSSSRGKLERATFPKLLRSGEARA